MVNTFVDFKEDLAQIFRILVACLLKKELFKELKELYGQKQENSE